MSVKPLPEKIMDEKKIDEFVNKGGKAIEDTKVKDENAWTMISLRLPKNLLKKIDANRAETIGITRNAWLLQVIQQKLKES